MAQKPAREKLMDYLARRDHSEKELRQKLSRLYDHSEVEKAIHEAKENGWLAPSEEMALKVAKTLHAKRKGYFYICHYLQKKGLPSIDRNPALEFQKAQEIAEIKLGNNPTVWKAEAQKLTRCLKSRGFEDEIIWKVIYEKQTNS